MDQVGRRVTVGLGGRSARVGIALHRLALQPGPAATAAVPIEQALGALAAHDRGGHGVRVLLVRVASLPDAALGVLAAAVREGSTGAA